MFANVRYNLQRLILGGGSGCLVPVVMAAPLDNGSSGGFAEAPPKAEASRELSAFLEDGLEKQVRAFELGCSTSLMYDSNVGQSPDSAQFPAEGGMVLMVSPALQWRAGDSQWNGGISLAGGYSYFFDNPDYNGTNYSANGTAGYDGGRWELNGQFSESFQDGQNRYYGASVSQFNHGVGLGGSYTLSPKTTLKTAWSSSYSEPDGGYGGTENHSFDLSAMWRYSSLLSVGPGMRWTMATGDVQAQRDTLGPTLSATYRLSKKVSLIGDVNLQFVDYEGGASDEFVSAGLRANYALNRLWAFDLSLDRGAQADGSLAGGFRETTAVRFGVSRKVRRASLGLGLAYERSDYITTSGAASRAPMDYATGDISLAMPVWKEQASATVFLRYRDSSSSEERYDWTGVQTGCSLNFHF